LCGVSLCEPETTKRNYNCEGYSIPITLCAKRKQLKETTTPWGSTVDVKPNVYVKKQLKETTTLFKLFWQSLESQLASCGFPP
jgi:hypothetical protein